MFFARAMIGFRPVAPVGLSSKVVIEEAIRSFEAGLAN
jgi:hypothetical protein